MKPKYENYDEVLKVGLYVIGNIFLPQNRIKILKNDQKIYTMDTVQFK